MHVLGAIRLEPVVHRGVIAPFELAGRSREDVGEAFVLQPPHDGCPPEAAVTGHVDPGVPVDFGSAAHDDLLVGDPVYGSPATDQAAARLVTGPLLCWRG